MFDVVHLLTGDRSFPPLLDSMVALYVEKRRFDVERTAWYSHYVDPKLALEFVAAYDALPEPSRLHLLLTPANYEAVHEFIKDPSPSAVEVLIAQVRDEQAVVNGSFPLGYHGDAEQIWNPMGDAMLQRAGNGWEQRAMTQVDSIILVDFDSPQARNIRPTSPLMYRPAEDFTDDERALTMMKLRQSLSYIDSVVPTFGRLIRNYTRAIRLRKSEARSHFSSEHVANTIGEIRILNAHKSHYGVTKLAEALIHESVHNFLSTYEYLYQPFVLSSDDKQYRPVSPWSGNPIPVPSFCHAVFVWFALFQFAQRELLQPNLTAERRNEISKRRNMYASGFLIPTPIFECAAELGSFSASIPATLNSLQSIVRSFVSGEVSLAAEGYDAPVLV